MNDQGPTQYLTVSLSGAWEYWGKAKNYLRIFFEEELARILPNARNARLLRFQVIKEQHATFRCLPGSTDNRLSARTDIPNFLLAGDWTNTGWPATMEGAVRSGEIVVGNILANPAE